MSKIDNVLSKRAAMSLYRKRLAQHPAATNRQLMEPGYPNGGRVPHNNGLIAVVRRYMGISKNSNHLSINTNIFYKRCRQHNLSKFVPVQPWPIHWKQTGGTKTAPENIKDNSIDRLAQLIKTLAIDGILIDAVIYNGKNLEAIEYTETKPTQSVWSH